MTHCQQLCKQLGVDDLTGKAAELEATKETIIRESILNETNVIKIGSKINDIQQKCAQLEQRVSIKKKFVLYYFLLFKIKKLLKK